MRGDRVAYSLWLLQTIIRLQQRTLQPLNIAFLDIKKAFDSVSHESILLAAGMMGVPPPARLSGRALRRRLDMPTHSPGPQ